MYCIVTLLSSGVFTYPTDDASSCMHKCCTVRCGYKTVEHIWLVQKVERALSQLNSLGTGAPLMNSPMGGLLTNFLHFLNKEMSFSVTLIMRLPDLITSAFNIHTGGHNNVSLWFSEIVTLRD